MKKLVFCLSALALGCAVSAQDSLAPLTVLGEQIEEAQGLSAADRELFQTEKVRQLLGLVPGFASTASDSAGFGDFIGVRGTGNTAFFGPAGVAMTVDGVPYGDAYTYSTDFFELSSAQLHRGPQGAYFGRNGAGGLLEFTTPGPTADPYFRLTTEYGNYDAFGARILASGPLSEKLSYTFQAYYNERDGYIDNTFLGTDVDSRERFGALANLHYRPSADTEIRFRAMVETARDGGQRLTNLPGQAGPFGLGLGLPQDPFQVQSDVLGSTALDRQQFSFHVTRDLGWATFESVSSYQTWNLGPNFTDLDLSNFGISTSSIQQNQDYMTNRYSLTSDQTQDLRWQLGLFRSKTESEGVSARSFPVPLPPTFMTTGPDTQTTSFNSEREIYAFYGNVSKDLSDRLTIEAGGRIEYVDTELSRSKGSAVYGPLGSFSGQTDDWYFSPTLGLSYKASEDVTLFGRTSIGIKPAGFTAFSDNPATSAYGEETAWETEAGVRLDRPEENWDLELRGYYKQIDDYQLNRSVLNSTDFIILNANEVRAIGVEAEANWKPSDKLSIAASAGWSQVEFEKFNDGTTDFGGNRVPFVPEFSAALGLRYDIGNGFFVSSSYRSIGSTTYEETGNANFKQASYQILDAQIGYEAENWSASVFGHNLLDEDYFSYLSPQIAAGSPGTPALYGVRVSVEF